MSDHRGLAVNRGHGRHEKEVDSTRAGLEQAIMTLIAFRSYFKVPCEDMVYGH